MRRWDGLLERYMDECATRGLMDSTLYGRRVELDRLGIWLKRRKPKPNLEEISSELLISYIRSRTAFHSKASICGVVTALRGIGGFLLKEGVWMKNPMRWIRGPKLDTQHRLPKRIGKEQLSKIWEAAESRWVDYTRYQALAVLALLYGTGLRRGELERLDMDDWQQEAGLLKVDGRKTGRERHVAVGAGVWRCVEAYLPHRHNLLEKVGGVDQENALFLNRFGARLNGQNISRLVHTLAKQAGVGLVSVHAFRHSCASDLLERGVSLPDIQKVLGHAVLASTMRYTHVTDPERTKAMQEHPINGFLINDNDERVHYENA